MPSSATSKKLFQAIIDNDAAAIRKIINQSNVARRPSKSSQSVGQIDLNERNYLGLSPLQLAVTLDRYEIVEILLSSSKVNVNLVDIENGWTALHRALYYGRLRIALLLMSSRKNDLDVRIKDKEKNSAYELLNSTIDGTSPHSQVMKRAKGNRRAGHEVYTWGSNSNFVLGHANSDDRAFAERVCLEDEEMIYSPDRLLYSRPIIKQFSMSKLHSAIITDRGLYTFGFGNGGRLGHTSSTKTQLTPQRVDSITGTILSVALGRDHTVVVTAEGVWVWGSNQFGQCGFPLSNLEQQSISSLSSKYSVHQGRNIHSGSTNNSTNNSLPLSPRKLTHGAFKKDLGIIGAAASKVHSVVFSEHAVYSFGLNQGQLGHTKTNNSMAFEIVQPRRVAMVPDGQKIKQIVANDLATAILFEGHDVFLLHDWGYHRLQFPIKKPFPVHHPKSANLAKSYAKVERIVTGGGGGDRPFYIGALCEAGEVFIFQVPKQGKQDHSISPSPIISPPVIRREKLVATQIWSKKWKWLMATDIAIGMDGSFLLSTAAGNVFQGQPPPEPSTKSSKPIKFTRVSYLQRIVSVAANNSGAFGAIKRDLSLKKVNVSKGRLGMDIGTALTLARSKESSSKGIHSIADGQEDEAAKAGHDEVEAESESQLTETEEPDTEFDHSELELSSFLDDGVIEGLNTAVSDIDSPLASSSSSTFSSFEVHAADHLRDIPVLTKTSKYNVHKCVLAARSSIFRDIFTSEACVTIDLDDLKKQFVKKNQYTFSTFPPSSRFTHRSSTFESSIPVELHFEDFSSTSMEAILKYMYHGIEYILPFLSRSKVDNENVWSELRSLSVYLNLTDITGVIDNPYTSVSNAALSRLSNDMLNLLLSPSDYQSPKKGAQIKRKEARVPDSAPFLSDVSILCQDDETVEAHQVILMLRCPFFGASLADRWREGKSDYDKRENYALVDLKHINVDVMKVIVKWIYGDESIEVFNGFEHATMNEYMEFVIDVLSAANELLLERLKEICQAVLRSFVNIRNVTYLLSVATFHEAAQLKSSCIDYINVNIETALEQKILFELDETLLEEIELDLKSKQQIKFPVTRSRMETELVRTLSHDTALNVLEYEVIKPPTTSSSLTSIPGSTSGSLSSSFNGPTKNNDSGSFSGSGSGLGISLSSTPVSKFLSVHTGSPLTRSSSHSEESDGDADKERDKRRSPHDDDLMFEMENDGHEHTNGNGNGHDLGDDWYKYSSGSRKSKAKKKGQAILSFGVASAPSPSSTRQHNHHNGASAASTSASTSASSSLTPSASSSYTEKAVWGTPSAESIGRKQSLRDIFAQETGKKDPISPSPRSRTSHMVFEKSSPSMPRSFPAAPSTLPFGTPNVPTVRTSQSNSSSLSSSASHPTAAAIVASSPTLASQLPFKVHSTTKLSQKERRRQQQQQSQNLPPSQPSASSMASPASSFEDRKIPPKPVWGASNDRSSTSSLNKSQSLREIQLEEQTNRANENKTHFRAALLKNSESHSTVHSPFSSPHSNSSSIWASQNPSPSSFNTKPSAHSPAMIGVQKKSSQSKTQNVSHSEFNSTSFTRIQHQQILETKSANSLLKKSLKRIQVEEQAVNDIIKFYKNSKLNASGEWFTVSRS
ncbi:hypothetical protein BKA69DRAFT_1061491 [Paraphysoderma sedebokerense]|nr:hypothetical protein BKA69DRAFT_1061491 [Paraphysoderma sedebokerense]